MTPTTSEDTRRLSSNPNYIGQTREVLVGQDRSQRPSLPASISRSRGLPRLHQRQGAGTPRPRQGAVVAADSEQTVGIVERMARGGATSQLPTVPSARAPSTRPVRSQPLAEARQRQTLSHRQILSRRRHLQQQRRRQDALMRISIAKIGPPTENVRRIPASCWNLVLRAAVPALRQSRVSMRTSIAQIGQPVENVRQTLATCWKLVLRAVVPALEAPAHHRNQLQLHLRRLAPGARELCSNMVS